MTEQRFLKPGNCIFTVGLKFFKLIFYLGCLRPASLQVEEGERECKFQLRREGFPSRQSRSLRGRINQRNKQHPSVDHRDINTHLGHTKTHMSCIHHLLCWIEHWLWMDTCTILFIFFIWFSAFFVTFFILLSYSIFIFKVASTISQYNLCNNTQKKSLTSVQIVSYRCKNFE